MQFHPLAYIVKLKIEMSMADLIAKIAKVQDESTTFQGGAKRKRHSINSQNAFTNPSMKVIRPPGRNRKWSSFSSGSNKSSIISIELIKPLPTITKTDGLIQRPASGIVISSSHVHDDRGYDINEEDMRVHTTREVTIEVEARASMIDPNSTEESFGRHWVKSDEDMEPLRDRDSSDKKYGVITKVWKG